MELLLLLVVYTVHSQGYHHKKVLLNTTCASCFLDPL